MANRDLRIRSLIGRNIVDIIHFELKNARIGFLTVSEVKVDSDHSHAKVYVTFLDAISASKQLAELNRCRGFIRHSLAAKLALRRVPEIEFCLDESFQKAEHIEELLKKEGAKLAELKKRSEKK